MQDNDNWLVRKEKLTAIANRINSVNPESEEYDDVIWLFENYDTIVNIRKNYEELVKKYGVQKNVGDAK